jgi:hypothetical protein
MNSTIRDMKMVGAGLNFVQICYVVPNLEQACAEFHAMFGIGPFIGGGEVVLDRHTYRGEAADPIVVRGVFGQSGDLNVELLELVSTSPSAFRDVFPGRQGGVHHAAIFCDDYVQARDGFSDRGMSIVSEFETDFGARICYIDTRERLGHMLELYPENDIIRGMYARTRYEAEHWDRAKLIIPW